MLKEIRQKFLWLLGAAQILQQQQRLINQQQLQQKVLISIGNALKYSQTDSKEIKTSTTYKRCAEIISLLTPMDVIGGKYVRLGSDHDGGYVMLDNFLKQKVEAVYSFGVGKDISWDEAIANYGADVFLFDHTVEQLPRNHPKCFFYKTGLTGKQKGNNSKTLSELITKNGHTACKNMIMKMDIEGCEWDVLSDVSSDVLSQFSQIIVEFHGISSSVYSKDYLKILEALKRINLTHQSVHVHGNNYLDVLWVDNLVVPNALEVTYIRRADVNDNLVKNKRQFPTELDQSNSSDFADIYLGDFSVKDNIE